MYPTRQFLFALVLTAAYGVAGASADELSPWQSTVDQQLQSFQSGDDAEAYSHAAPNIKRFFPTLEGFMAMVEGGYPQVRRPKSWSMGRSIPLTASSVAQEVIIVGPEGKLWKALYTLELQEDGSWQISGVSLQGMKSFGV
ncbi:DUF4864 domain-containing protein [Notoacmeibacter ruber]|uniref:DUF4864 domain-containing protein n=1 Tax=Notoacmeibacter ruber TaxID=2670375 RepID=A0A3L7JHI7_9HYPH|nr:DUF4864 domain-containing protein [Notoacmeibacter ruber]RLQ87952.1 DUF4864 domain-containing protein [Notoacmeibacter ruber]